MKTYIDSLTARQRAKVVAGRRAVVAHRAVRRAFGRHRAAVIARYETLVSVAASGHVRPGELALRGGLTARRVQQIRAASAVPPDRVASFGSRAEALAALRRSAVRVDRSAAAEARARSRRARAVAECRAVGWTWHELHELLGLSVSSLRELVAGFNEAVRAGSESPVFAPDPDKK